MASNGAPPAKKGGSEAPNATLYLTNITDKLRKPDLRLSLYTLFSTYGPVLDVIAMPGAKMRGQAHIVMQNEQASTQAMRALQGFDFFGKEMKIQYGRGRSNIFSKLSGETIASTTETTQDTRQSLFSVPLPGTSAASATPAGLPPKPGAAITNGSNGTKEAEQAPQGTKRPREDEDDDEDAPMEEDSDVPMEASSDED